VSTWTPPQCDGPVVATVTIPGSKSEANRALLLAAIGDAPSTVTGVPVSRDSELMIRALTTLGADVDESCRVTPPSVVLGGGSIDCGLAGTVMRFVPPLAMLADAPVGFTGDARASQRPMIPLCDALRALGATVTDDALPFTLTPPREWAPTAITIDSGASSQFVSGLLLAGARFPFGLDLRHVGGALPSRPHIDMTIAMLKQRGVAVTEPEPEHWLVSPGPLAAIDCAIDPDLTNAAAFLLAGVITGGAVTVPGWPATTTQPGDAIRGVIKSFAAGETDVDLSAASELTPVVATLNALTSGSSRLTGIGHIRGHETDRLQAIADGLGAIGVAVAITHDGLMIEGGTPRHGGLIEARGDHRLVHMGALLGLVTPGVVVDDVESVAKTMPDFVQRWSAMVGR